MSVSDFRLFSDKVSEAQEAIEDFEDPNYDKLIQLEEDGKNRKTLLDFLESQQ
jgi:hypothetical protein